MRGPPVIGHADPQRTLFHQLSLETFVPQEHPLRAQDREEADGPPDPGNRAVDFRGEKRSNATHRSATDPDGRFVSEGTSGTGAHPGYTVTAVMENRHRFLLGLGVEVFQESASEETGCLALLARAKRRLRFTPHTLGADRRRRDAASEPSGASRHTPRNDHPRDQGRDPFHGFVSNLLAMGSPLGILAMPPSALDARPVMSPTRRSHRSSARSAPAGSRSRRTAASRRSAPARQCRSPCPLLPTTPAR